MKELIVSMERNGTMLPVGRISGENAEDSRFSYSENYLKQADPVPVSLSLPLRAEPFSAAQT